MYWDCKSVYQTLDYWNTTVGKTIWVCKVAMSNKCKKRYAKLCYWGRPPESCPDVVVFYTAFWRSESSESNPMIK